MSPAQALVNDNYVWQASARKRQPNSDAAVGIRSRTIDA